MGSRLNPINNTGCFEANLIQLDFNRYIVIELDDN